MAKKSEKVKVTFSHENGAEMYCNITISSSGMKMDVSNSVNDIMKSDSTLITLVTAFAKGIKGMSETEGSYSKTKTVKP